jgi:HD-like signal output (HDOD) protein
VISGIESLPSLPALYKEVVEEATSPNGSLNRVGEIMSRDVAMSAKILQIVNSSFFGLPQHVTTPIRAVNLLGLEIVKSLILSVKIFSQFGRSELPGYSMTNLWNHSISTGIVAKAIAKEGGIGTGMLDEAFAAGLLHDVGKLVLLDELPEKCSEISEIVSSANCRLWEAEQEILGTTHAQIGAYLMGIWGLSESSVEAIAFHHCPCKCPNEGFSTLTAVHMANHIVHHNPALDRDLMTGLDREYMERLDIADRVEDFRSVCGDSIG